MLISFDSRAVLEHHPSNLHTGGFIRAVDLGMCSTVPCDITAAPRGSYSPPPVPSRNRTDLYHEDILKVAVTQTVAEDSQTDRPACVRLSSIILN